MNEYFLNYESCFYTNPSNSKDIMKSIGSKDIDVMDDFLNEGY
jgi:hypothetical protein